MNYKISKELFETVMDEKYDLFDEESNYHIIYGGVNYEKSITYNAFFFKCKEWAFEKPYGCNTTMNTMYDLRTKTKNRIDWACDIVEDCGDGRIIKTTYSNSEQQAVFDACQWILDNEI